MTIGQWSLPHVSLRTFQLHFAAMLEDVKVRSIQDRELWEVLTRVPSPEFIQTILLG